MSKVEFIDAFVFLRTLNFRKCINGLLLRISYLLSKTFNCYIHWGKVESLSVEPTNLCNLKCPECPSGNNKMTRPRLFLSVNNFQKHIDECYATLAYLQLFFQGEPFLHPRIFDYIAYATSKNVYTSTSTNGQFLTKPNCNKIVESGLHRIIVSVDGATQEVYEKYRVGGSLDLLLGGIKDLVDAKNQLKSKTPFIIIQFVVFSTNEHQISEMKLLAKELNVDKLEIKTAQIDDFENGNNLIPRNKNYSRYIGNETGKYRLNRKSEFKCKRIWLGSVISADGKLLPCCFDKNADYAYDLPDKQTIKYNWKGKKALAFRKQVWSKNNSFKMCKNCTEGLK